jgi:hypothetical protein
MGGPSQHQKVLRTDGAWRGTCNDHWVGLLREVNLSVLELIRCALRDGHVSIRSGCRESNLPKPLLPSSHFNELDLLGFSPGNEV